MKERHGDRARLIHIQESIVLIEQFVVDIDYGAFLNSTLIQDAVIRRLEIIGEASNHLTGAIKEEFPEVKWRDIVRFRNVVVHEYFRIRIEDIWAIVTNDLPELKRVVEKMLENET